MPREFFVVAPGTIEFREYKEPSLRKGEVRVRSLLSGISHGTELNLYRGTTPFTNQKFDPELRMFVPGGDPLSFELQLGYEMIGEVVEVGEDVNCVAVGDLVHGYLRHRETNVAKAESLLRLPRELEPERGVFLVMGVIALNAVHDARIKVGDEVAVFGLGAIGLMAVQLARLNGASRVYAADAYAKRCSVAVQLGVDRAVNPGDADVAYEIKTSSVQRGVDVAIECSGDYRALQDALRSVRMGGEVVTLGYYQGAGSALNLGTEWHHNRLTMRSSMGVWGCPHRNFPLWDYQRLKTTIVELLHSGTLQTDGLITHRFPFAQAAEAYRLIDRQPEETIKVVLTY